MPIAVPRFIAPYTADADQGPYLIAKFGSVDGNCATAAAATDLLLGVTSNVPVAAGQVQSVIHSGTANVTYGAAVTAGQITPGMFLTSDANGCAVPAAPASGAVARTIGIALETSVGGGNEIHPILVHLGQVKG